MRSRQYEDEASRETLRRKLRRRLRDIIHHVKETEEKRKDGKKNWTSRENLENPRWNRRRPSEWDLQILIYSPSPPAFPSPMGSAIAREFSDSRFFRIAAGADSLNRDQRLIDLRRYVAGGLPRITQSVMGEGGRGGKENGGFRARERQKEEKW